MVASKAYYGNNKTFCGCLLFLTGLYQPGQQPWMLRYQLVIVYLGAGLNKLLDADWQSGVFFEHWAAHKVRHPVYLAIDSWLPPMWLARAMSWLTIVTELGLAVAFQVRRWFPYGIWASLLLHSGMLLFTGSTFTMFFYAMSASMLVFVDWPAAPLTAIYDGECGFCRRAKRWMEKIDLEQILQWVPYQDGGAERFGIPRAEAERRLQLVVGPRTYSGYAAIKMILLYNPVTYFVMAAMVAAPRSAVSTARMVMVAMLLALFLPPFEPIGQAVYGVIARNRRRLAPGGACSVE